MKQILKHKHLVFFFILIVLIGFFLQFVKNNEIPPCLNADEAAFGYNSYSLLKTGRDEYGSFLPLRLKSFGDYKLPLYSYLSMPFIAIFGLTETSTRLLAHLMAIAIPLVLFFLADELFKNKKIAMLVSFLAVVSPWIQTLGRQAHEVSLAAFFISLTALFLIRFEKSLKRIDFILFVIFNGLSLFAYHISRTFALFFFFYLLFILWRGRHKFKNKVTIAFYIIIFLMPLFIFLHGEIKSAPERLKNLIFYNSQGFKLRYQEMLNENNSRIIHNPLSQALLDVPKEYIKYFSPQFMVVFGDTNPRFGFPGISPITFVEFIFFLIGIYYLFKEKQKYRFFIILMLLVAPVSGALTWLESSITRSFYMIVPILIITSYGVSSFYKQSKGIAQISLYLSICVYFFYLFFSWDFYLLHYLKRKITSVSWQCGYKELVSYVKNNYSRFDEFRITKRNGEPYIFFLYYLQYDPVSYQRQASLSPPDEYGFGQVENFDKFYFNHYKKGKGVSYIGFPESFSDTNQFDLRKIKKIKQQDLDIFWIYEF